MVSKVRSRRRRKQNKIGMLLVTVVVIMLVSVFFVRSIELQARDQEYQKKIAKLTKQLQAEEERTCELQEREKYMQTKKFIEEYAQEKMGLVYPDEIIFKSEEK